MTKTFLKQHAPRALVLSALFMAGAARSAHAVTLVQKWQAGQQLDYNLALNGTINAMAPADAPFFMAGVPLQAKLDLNAHTVFDALSVDDDGTGTVALRVNGLKMTAEAFGGAMVVENGRAKMMMNGVPLDGGRNLDLSKLQNPPYALRISKQGRITNFVPVKNSTDAETKAAPENPKAFDLSNFVVPLIMRALPTLWPAEDVKIGDKWQGEIGWPVLQPDGDNAAEGAPAAAEPLPTIGKMNFTLEAEEEMLGRKTQRIAVDGEVTIDAARAATLNKKADGKNGMPRLTDAKQKVKGNVWFDSEAGHVVRADLKLQTTAHGQGKSNGAAGNSYMNFDGTLKMDLNKVSYAGTGVAPANQ